MKNKDVGDDKKWKSFRKSSLKLDYFYTHTKKVDLMFDIK